MTDRELLDRIRAVVTELNTLTQAADQNAKYHTRGVLRLAWHSVNEAYLGLVWHVEKD